MPRPRSAAAIEALDRLDRSRELPYVRKLTALHRAMLERFDRDLDGLEALIEELKAEGKTPDPWVLMRHQRTQRLLDNYERYVRQLVADADRWTRNQATAGQEMLEAARQALEREIADTPALVGDVAGVKVQDAFQSLDREGFGQLLDETRSTRTRNLLSSLAGAARDEVAEELLYGLASGRSFKDTARSVRKVANAPLARTLTITRTEGMRAQREALRTGYERSDVTAGWIWWATGDQRTCFLCLARHGEKYPHTRPMVSHPNCRCSMLPDLQTPEDLGIGGGRWDDPDRGTIQETGEDLLARMPEADQRRILGNERYELLQDGKVSLEDLWHEVDRGPYRNLEAVPLDQVKARAGIPVSRETPDLPGDKVGVRQPIDPDSPEFRPLPKEPKLPDRGPAWRSTTKGQRVPEVEDAVEQAANQARQLLDLPDLPTSITYRRIRGNAQGGYYVKSRDIEIDVRVGPDTAAHYYQHELGHFIDGHLGAGFDQAVGRAVVRNTPHRTELLAALKDTDAFRGLSRVLQDPALHTQRRYAKYMASDNELMARVLAQYMAYKVGGRGMAGFKATVERRLALGVEADQFYAFSVDDMRRLYPAIEKYLREIGVLR